LKRYVRNIKTLSVEENNSLRAMKVCVVGCGGLGGYVIEMLGRIGIGHITAVDGDVFDETNLNRQLLSETNLIGISKSKVAFDRMQRVNPEIELTPVNAYLDSKNGEDILKGHDLVVDALDNVPSKILLKDICCKLKMPLVHGAIGGWYGQVTSIFPGDNTLDMLYKDVESAGIEKELGNPPFTPALIASIQVSEAIKILIKRGDVLRNRVLYVDLLSMEFNIIEFQVENPS